MTSDYSHFICNQLNCLIRESGKCLEGIVPPSSCPHLQESVDVEDVEERAAILNDVTTEDQGKDDLSIEDDISIPYGDDLTISEAGRIMGHHLSRLIVVAGEAESGKTTIIARIHSEFLKGPFGGFDFSWSETLPGFERRCHHSRIASMRKIPETYPTKETRLLHLRVRPTNGPIEETQDLLFADIPGEEFEKVRDSEEDARSMDIIKRADRVLVLIDGAKLIDLSRRQKAKAQAEMLLRRLLDTGMLGRRSIVDVLFTKNDLIELYPENDEVTAILDDIIKGCTRKFSTRLGQLSFYRVAARPPRKVQLNSSQPIDDLFKYWVRETMQFNSIPIIPYSLRGETTTGRQFDSFIERRLPQYLREKEK